MITENGQNIILLYKDATLNGADPVLDDGMIPIYYDGNTVKKANVLSKWYNYEAQEWANIILVKDEKRAKYKQLSPGSEIENDDILAYYVWIPGYSYAIPAGNGAREISVNFENNRVVKKNGSAVGTDFFTHPAFTFGEKELNGFWVGKFHTSSSSDTECYNSYVALNESMCTAEKVEPRVLGGYGFVIVYQNAYNAHLSAKKLENSYYGIISSDSHVQTAYESGALAYLSQSKYGKYGNTMYTGINKEIFQNKSTYYAPGLSFGVPNDNQSGGTRCSWTDITDRGNGTGACGGGASTTGNITGVYDTNGAAYELVMGIYANNDGTPIVGQKSNTSSGFNGLQSDGTTYTSGVELLSSKYINRFNSLESFKGTASTETRNWYTDEFANVDTTCSWYARGENSWTLNNKSGIFATNCYGGNSLPYVSYRLSLTNK